MPRGRRILPSVVVLGLLALAAWGQSRAIESSHERELLTYAPELGASLARHLMADTDARWLAHCHAIGTYALATGHGNLAQALRVSDYREFLRRRALVGRALLRIGVGLRAVYDFPGPERRIRRDLSLRPEVDFEQRQNEARYIAIASEGDRSPDARIRELDEITKKFYANGDSARPVYVMQVAAQLELDAGRFDRHRARLESALDCARERQDYLTVCQILGTMGIVHRRAGEDDSMKVRYDEGIEIALRHGFIDQATRMLKFYATHYAERGRLAIALDQLAAAMRLAEGPGGEGTRLRLELEYGKFLAELGCWDLVDRAVRRLPPLLRAQSMAGNPHDGEKYRFESDLLQAKLELATGRTDDGTRRLAKLLDRVPPDSRRPEIAEIFDIWTAGIEATGRGEDVLEICRRGLIHCDTAHVPELAPHLFLRAARTQASLGRIDEAEALLDSANASLAAFRQRLPRPRLESEILAARLLGLRGDHVRARRRIRSTYRAFRDQLSKTDAGSMSYLVLDEARALNDAIHEIEDFTPQRACEFEMEWRSLTRTMGGRSGRGVDREARPTRVRGRDEVHLVYRFANGVLLRWTDGSEGVVVDTLPCSAESCVVMVRTAVAALETESARPGEFLGSRAAASLLSLSRLLLPARLPGAPEVPGRIHVTPDGPLSALPFEALPWPPRENAPPLAMAADLDYVRGGTSAPAPRDSGRVVVVSNPALPKELAIRYGWGAADASSGEVSDALTSWPGATVLAGAQATKQAIRASWPGASVIYLAAHHVRDPEAPFLGFIPLAAPAGASPDAAILEIADIHALDLSACRLAVLASCASGAPYRTGVQPGPTLSDAFLDAGASAVVRSFWDVGDAEAREFMKVFLAHRNAGEADAVNLGRARRAVMRTAAGVSPRVWAAWSVETVGR